MGRSHLSGTLEIMNFSHYLIVISCWYIDFEIGLTVELIWALMLILMHGSLDMVYIYVLIVLLNYSSSFSYSIRKYVRIRKMLKVAHTGNVYVLSCWLNIYSVLKTQENWDWCLIAVDEINIILLLIFLSQYIYIECHKMKPIFVSL